MLLCKTLHWPTLGFFFSVFTHFQSNLIKSKGFKYYQILTTPKCISMYIFILVLFAELQTHHFFFFLAALGFHCYMRAFSSCSEWGLCGARTSHCGGFSLLQNTGSRHMGFSSCGSQALERRLSSCSSQA